MVRNILPPIHVHPILILFIAISIITGTLIEMLIIFIIVFIHEMGHYLMARFFGWRIRRIMLWVFGGVMETEEHGNRSIKEEVLVTLAGPLQHFFIFALLHLLLQFGFIPDVIFQTAIWYNTIILLFNLLPIWPLDGGKILFQLFSFLMPFKKALDMIFLLSLVLCLSFAIGHFFFFPFTLTFALLMLFLFLENRMEWKRRFYIFMRFLMARYRGNHTVQKMEPLYLSGHQTLMEVFSHFKRDKKHTIILNDKSNETKRIDEADCLHAYFHEKRYANQINELF